MDGKEIAEKWLSVFGKNVPEKIMGEHVRAYGNFLWHIFTWGEVSCLKGKDAKQAYDEVDCDNVLQFQGGYADSDHGIDVKELKRTRKRSSRTLDKEDDIYIVADDFSWTYVHTHEWGLGPYFCRIKEIETATE